MAVLLWVVMTAGVAFAGLVQTVTGFGSVVLMMLLFPFFFNMIDAPALALSINVLYCFVLCWKFRRDIDWHACLLPTVIYSAVSFAVTGLVGDADLQVLVIAFAVFLILLSLYLLFVSGRVKMKKPGVGVGAALGVLAGTSAGLFAIGGPPMAPYMMAATKDHKAYVASMQLMFSVTNVVNLAGRMVNGIYRWSLWPYIAVGSVCIIIGMYLGEWIAKRLDAQKLRTIVYGFVGVSGLILLLQQI